MPRSVVVFLNADVTPVPFGVDRLIMMLSFNVNADVSVVLIDEWYKPAVLKFVPVEVAFR